MTLILVTIAIVMFFLFLFKGMYVYSKIDIRKIDRFIFVLLYKVYSDESIFHNGRMSFGSIDRKREIIFSKYKERGIIGIKILIYLYHDIKNTEDILIDELQKRNIYYYKKKIIFKKADEYIAINIGKNLKECKSLIEFIWENIYKRKDKKGGVWFMGIEKIPGKYIDFNSTQKLEGQNYDIDIPTTNLQHFLRKIKKNKWTLSLTKKIWG